MSQNIRLSWALVLALTLPVQTLVNRAHPLKDLQYEPASLSTPGIPLLNSVNLSDVELAPEAADAFTRMAKAAHQDNVELRISSGFRSYNQQALLYSEEHALPKTTYEYVAPPGTSEHQTGLAADIMTGEWFCAAQDCFMLTKAAAWLTSNSYSYGFILRYPLGKESTTGYGFEPWHYRYVGKSLAQYLHTKHLTLEEYYTSRV